MAKKKGAQSESNMKPAKKSNKLVKSESESESSEESEQEQKQVKKTATTTAVGNNKAAANSKKPVAKKLVNKSESESESESSSEEERKKPAATKKPASKPAAKPAATTKPAAKKKKDSESESESESSSESEEETVKPKKSVPVKTTTKPAAKKKTVSSEEESSSSSEESSDEEKPKTVTKPITKKRAAAAASFAALGGGSDDEEEEESESSSESEEEEEKPKKPTAAAQTKKPVEQSKAAPKPKAEKKKKAEDEDIDALLNELEKPKTQQKPQPATTSTVATAEATAEEAVVPTLADGTVDESKMSKAQLKRHRQKLKAEADKAAGISKPAAEEKKATETPAAAAEKEEKKKPTKISKQALALKEALQKQKEAEERKKREEEEAKQREIDEENRRIEEEKRKEQEKEERKLKKQQEKEELRRKGLLKSKSEREKAAKAQAQLELMRAQGIIVPEVKRAESDEAKAGKVKYGNKKPKKQEKNGEETTIANQSTDSADIQSVTEGVAALSVAEKNKPAAAGKGGKRQQQAALEAAKIREQAELAKQQKQAAEADNKVAEEKLAADNKAASVQAAAEIARIEAELKALEEKEEQKANQEIEKMELEITALQAKITEKSEIKSPVAEEDVPDSWDAESDDESNKTETTSSNNNAEEIEKLKKELEKTTANLEKLRKQKAAEKAAREESGQKRIAKAVAEKKAMEEAQIAAAKQAQKEKDEKAAAAAAANNTANSKKEEKKGKDLRSPIACILGHVDTGKTKLLDFIRQSNVQKGEAGGITQQIGATWIPREDIIDKTAAACKALNKELDMKLPGLLIIDTPGHESFTNLRSRGSGLCDIAILVVDLMAGLEQQTIESINLLKMRKTPFVIALNKIDRCYDWKAIPNAAFRTTFATQKVGPQQEFETKASKIKLQLAEQGLNTELYWQNPDIRKYVNIVPTSAITGEGVPDLLLLMCQLTQSMMSEKLSYLSELQCTVLEVKVIEGLGTTIDVILVNGYLHVGDTIVICGLHGPIVTTIKALLTPPPLTELRVKSQYVHHDVVKAAMGVKISAHGLEEAVAGSQLLVCGKRDNLEDLKDEVMQDLATILSKIDKSGVGVCVQASTLGALEALLSFLGDCKIPVSGINIGPVHKKDVMRAGVMLERKPEYALILAFDVKVAPEVEEIAENMGVKIFTADIIYHLFDKCTAYMNKLKEERRAATADTAVFPVVLDILPNAIFNTKNPIVLGCKVVDGVAKIGTPLCCPAKDKIVIGKITSIQKNHEEQKDAKKGDEVAIKIEQLPGGQTVIYGRHFDHTNQLVSKLTRESIDLLKANFKEDLSEADWRCVIKLKQALEIM